jgi:hypothetical protein
MIRAIAAIVILGASLSLPASAQLLTTGYGPGSMGGSAGGATNLLLLVDGSSRVLQTDGASRICLAGGC